MTTRVSFICTGNICRSPMAEVVLRHIVNGDATLRGRIDVSSAGTANWHVGSAMDPRARAALDRAGFDTAGSEGAYATAQYLEQQDLIVVMTREHRSDVTHRLRGSQGSVILIRSLINDRDELDLADPYYGDDGEFDDCLATIIRSCRELVPRLRLGDGPFEA